MKKWIYLGAASFLLIGCGTKTSKKKNATDVYGGRSLGVPVPLMVSQKACLSGSILNPLEIDLYRRGRERPFRTDFSSEIQAVETTEFAGSFRGRDQFSLLNSPEIENPSKIFEVCDIAGEYESNSYQDAALSILTPIKSFENRYPKLINGLSLPQIKIRVAPLLRQGDQYLINNAFYYSGTREITFLPQGYDSKEDLDLPMGGRPLWKFPMVALHEYGHHIFVELLRKYSDQKSSLPPLGLCFDNSHHYHKVQSSAQSRNVSVNLALIAVNEAFADIFAYFGEPGSRGLDGMGCMEKSRDVESRTFNNGDIKILHKEQIEIFLSSAQKEYTGCNEMTNYQDTHIIGAVLGRAIFKVFEFQRVSDQKKLEILIDWLEQFLSKVNDETDPKLVLKLAVDEFYEVAKQEVRIDPLRCIKYYSHFPGITRNGCY
ncbi:MAG: hypothetical protein CME65_10055 [Halobacteriovoraceae bacterium]|nr:hypothetical protein [Halobacteriovoraceae bacterium]